MLPVIYKSQAKFACKLCDHIYINLWKNNKPGWDLRFSRLWVWRWLSSGMLFHVVLQKLAGVSEELIASIIRVMSSSSPCEPEVSVVQEMQVWFSWEINVFEGGTWKTIVVFVITINFFLCAIWAILNYMYVGVGQNVANGRLGLVAARKNLNQIYCFMVSECMFATVVPKAIN
jgi:hypothetical protein